MQTAALTVAAGLPATSRADEPATMPIIDTHQHLWDLSQLQAPLAQGRPEAGPVLPDGRLPAGDGGPQRRQVGLHGGGRRAVATARRGRLRTRPDPPRRYADGRRRDLGPTRADGFATYLARYKDQPAIKGLRRVLHAADTPPGHCLDKRFIDGIRLLGKLGLSFDLCMRPAELGDAAKLIDACPDTAFILDHCGNASVRAKDLSGWKADIGRIAERKNVVCKVSGIVASAAPGPWTADDLAPIVNHVLDAVRPRSRRLRRRLACLHARRDLSPVGRGAASDRRQPVGRRPEEAVPRQRVPGLSTFLTRLTTEPSSCPPGPQPNIATRN